MWTYQVQKGVERSCWSPMTSVLSSSPLSRWKKQTGEHSECTCRSVGECRRFIRTPTLSSGSTSKKKRTTYRPKDRSEWIGVKVPPIVSQELFDSVQERLRQNRQRYLRPPIRHLLGGMLRCGECGSAMYSYDRYYTRMTTEPRLGVYHKAAYNCLWRIRAHEHCKDVIERCHNSEIRTHILENRVLQLIHDVLCNPDKLRRCIELPADTERMERKKLRRRLTTFDTRMKELDAERRRLINLYATGELDKDAYINASAALDRELEVLQRTKAALGATQSLNKRAEMDVRIRQFCEQARARFERCIDFDTRRQFLRDHIEHVIYHPRSVVLIGSIPGDLNGSEQAHASGALQFRIKGTIRRIKTTLGPRKRGAEAPQSDRLAAVSS
jgi:hypothetical protein